MSWGPSIDTIKRNEHKRLAQGEAARKYHDEYSAQKAAQDAQNRADLKKLAEELKKKYSGEEREVVISVIEVWAKRNWKRCASLAMVDIDNALNQYRAQKAAEEAAKKAAEEAAKQAKADEDAACATA